MTPRAFTIVEVIAALGLLAMLVGLMTSTMSSMAHRSAWIHERAQRERGASVAIDRLATALRTTIVQAPDATPGVRGDANAITVLARTAPRPGNDASDLAAVSIRCDTSASTLSGVWSDAGTGADSERHPLARGVLARLRYHDGQAWRESFDSAQSGRLPGAVEIAIWFGAPEPDPDAADAADTRRTVEYPEREPDRLRVIAVPDPEGEVSP